MLSLTRPSFISSIPCSNSLSTCASPERLQTTRSPARPARETRCSGRAAPRSGPGRPSSGRRERAARRRRRARRDRWTPGPRTRRHAGLPRADGGHGERGEKSKASEGGAEILHQSRVRDIDPEGRRGQMQAGPETSERPNIIRPGPSPIRARNKDETLLSFSASPRSPSTRSRRSEGHRSPAAAAQPGRARRRCGALPCHGDAAHGVSAGAELVPVPLPGLDVAADVALLTQLIPAINREFGLTPAQIEALSPTTKCSSTRRSSHSAGRDGRPPDHARSDHAGAGHGRDAGHDEDGGAAPPDRRAAVSAGLSYSAIPSARRTSATARA